MRLLLVPTYPHLSEPVINRIIEREKESVCTVLQFYEPFKAFGGEVLGVYDVDVIRHLPKNRGLMSFLRFLLYCKKDLLVFLEEQNFDKIITFSDATFFTRILSGTKFESKLYILQPCPISRHELSKCQIFKFALKRLLNKLLPVPILRQEVYWGSNLDLCHYGVWGDLELGYLRDCKNVLVDTTSLNVEINIEIDNNAKSVLAIAPDFNFYTDKEVLRYFSILQHTTSSFPGLKFFLKLHPLNEIDVSRFIVNNIEMINDESLTSITNRYLCVICGYSFMALRLRIEKKAICIFDLGSYVNQSDPRIGKSTFHYVSSSRELSEFLDLSL